METYVFIIVSFIVHVILFLSIFDIYFTSPIVHGMREFPQSINAPAKRLVLFVADGLRADKFYEIDENKQTRAPFLRNIILNEGNWGVSHTRVPTESRPGHVAMIAGFYEDVSAIMKGWKENPVEFDSVFNQSRDTWAFGSPDILPMFAKGDSESRVHIHCYHSNIESFAGDDSSLLDDWVFDHFSSFIKEAKSNATLYEALNKDKVVFFLHLLGIDTNGHSHKPMSKEYLLNIKKVDKGVENVANMIEQFYDNDKQTAYVFTADHGMTDWGSHGAGLPSETLTPLVVWGAGAKKHGADSRSLSVEEQQKTRLWGLDPSLRRDVNQADIAPLMAGLVGVPIPVNSVGVLPHNYISLNSRSKAKLMLTNMKQITEQFLIKRSFVKSTSFVFKPFSKLSPSQIIDSERKISEMIRSERFDAAITECRRVIYLSLEGLQYYHTYHRVPLYIAVVFSFIGWIFYNVLLILSRIDFISTQAKKLAPYTSDQSNRSIFFAFLAFGMFTTMMLFLLRLPWSYYFYFLLPLLIWYYIAKQRYLVYASFIVLNSNYSFAAKLACHCFLVMVGVWLLVASFFHRYVLTIELIIFGIFALSSSVRFHTKVAWISFCLLMSVFPLLPVVGREPSVFLVCLGAVFGFFFSYFAKSSTYSSFPSFIVFLPLVSGFLSSITSFFSSQKGQVPFLVHVCSWSLLVSSWLIPLFSSTHLIPRILSIFTCHCASYILISLSYDALFCVFFCVFLSVWIRLEVETSKNARIDYAMDFNMLPLALESQHQLSFDVLRRSYFLLFFIVLAFFGVGNIASINSFDVKIVLPFVTVFDPFIMGALLAYKVLLPYLLVACTLCCVAIATKTDLNQLFRFSLIISDVMALHFFFMVKDHGSWLDIGTSISHYVINMSMVTALLLFFGAAKLLTTRRILFGGT